MVEFSWAIFNAAADDNLLFFLSLVRGCGDDPFCSESFSCPDFSVDGNMVGWMSLALNLCSNDILLLLRWLSSLDGVLPADFDTFLCDAWLGEDSWLELSMEPFDDSSDPIKDDDEEDCVDEELVDKSDGLDAKSDVGELLHRLWSKLNLAADELELFLDKRLMSTDNLLFLVSELICMVFSVVYDVFRALVSFFFSVSGAWQFSFMKENSFRSPVLFKGAAFPSTVSLLRNASTFCVKLGATDFATLMGGDEISSSLLLLPLLIDEPVEVRSILFALHRWSDTLLSRLLGDCSLILVGFPDDMVMNVFVASLESPYNRSQLLDVRSNKLARYLFSL